MCASTHARTNERSRHNTGTQRHVRRLRSTSDPSHVDDMREDLEGIVNRVDRLKRDLGLADPWTYAPDEDPPDYEDDYDVADWSRQRDQYEQASELVALRGFAHHYLAELSPATPPATGVANSDKSKRRRVDNRPTKRRVESLTRTGHFEAARSALDRLYSDVSTKGWQPTIELEVARAQHWLTAARCADEQVPPRQFDSSHSTDWRTDFWTHLPRPDEWSDESPYAPLNSFCSWTRTATYRLGQLGRCLDADIESTLTELEAAGRCLADELERYAINLPGAPRVHHLCLEVLLADVKAVKAALLARELVAKYSPAPFPLDEDDVHADKQANKQGECPCRLSSFQRADSRAPPLQPLPLSAPRSRRFPSSAGPPRSTRSPLWSFPCCARCAFGARSARPLSHSSRLTAASPSRHLRSSSGSTWRLSSSSTRTKRRGSRRHRASSPRRARRSRRAKRRRRERRSSEERGGCSRTGSAFSWLWRSPGMSSDCACARGFRSHGEASYEASHPDTSAVLEPSMRSSDIRPVSLAPFRHASFPLAAFWHCGTDTLSTTRKPCSELLDAASSSHRQLYAFDLPLARPFPDLYARPSSGASRFFSWSSGTPGPCIPPRASRRTSARRRDKRADAGGCRALRAERIRAGGST